MVFIEIIHENVKYVHFLYVDKKCINKTFLKLTFPFITSKKQSIFLPFIDFSKYGI